MSSRKLKTGKLSVNSQFIILRINVSVSWKTLFVNRTTFVEQRSDNDS